MLPVNHAFARNLLRLYVFHSTSSRSRFSWQLELKRITDTVKTFNILTGYRIGTQVLVPSKPAYRTVTYIQ